MVLCFLHQVQTLQPGAQDSDPIERFCQEWILNEDARRKLLQLTPDEQQVVMQGFKPDPSIIEVSGKFISFAASVQKARRNTSNIHSAAVQYANPSASWQKTHSGPVGVLEAFCKHWSLNADAQAKLLKLAPEVRQLVMDGFSPPPHIAEVSGKFISFANSIERARAPGTLSVSPPAVHDERGSFFQYWGLSADAQAKLLQLPPDRQQAVMASFNPPAGTNDINGRFIMFVNGFHKTPGYISTGATGFASRQSVPQKRTFESTPAESQLHAFIQHWALNDDAQTKLWKLTPEVQELVMANFAPRGTVEVSGKFIMFAASIEKAQQGYSSWQGPAKRMRV